MKFEAIVFKVMWAMMIYCKSILPGLIVTVTVLSSVYSVNVLVIIVVSFVYD